MTVPHLAVDCRTNLPRKSIPKNFLCEFSAFLQRTFKTESKKVQIEIQTDVLMIRDGCTDPMLNMNFNHDSEKITQETKTDWASDIANFIYRELDIPKERVLILFFNTKKCT